MTYHNDQRSHDRGVITYWSCDQAKDCQSHTLIKGETFLSSGVRMVKLGTGLDGETDQYGQNCGSC